MCSNYQQELITSFIDGELKITEQIELFKHLAGCSECQLFIDTLMRIREIEKREKIQCPAEVDEAILSRLSQKNRPTFSDCPGSEKIKLFRMKHRITIPVPVAVTAAATAIIVGFLLSGIFFRGAEPQILPASIIQQQAQPTAVIYIYSMPPIEVVSTAMVQTLNNNKKHIY